MTPPIPIRIVCTHDAAKVAEELRRLLSAEQHAVEICCGRQSLAYLDTARTVREAVVLIWSVDAPSSHYMLQWAANVNPGRLVEISRTRLSSAFADQRPHLIDFNRWEGQRGGEAWRQLEERLREVTTETEPPKPPPRYAAIALAAISAVAVGEALLLRLQDTHHDAIASNVAEETETPAVQAAGQAQPPASVVRIADAHRDEDGEGGALTIVEPASQPADDAVHITRAVRRVQLIDRAPGGGLTPVRASAPYGSYSDASLFDRLTAFAAPLLHRDETQQR